MGPSSQHSGVIRAPRLTPVLQPCPSPQTSHPTISHSKTQIQNSNTLAKSSFCGHLQSSDVLTVAPHSHPMYPLSSKGSLAPLIQGRALNPAKPQLSGLLPQLGNSGIAGNTPIGKDFRASMSTGPRAQLSHYPMKKEHEPRKG